MTRDELRITSFVVCLCVVLAVVRAATGDWPGAAVAMGVLIVFLAIQRIGRRRRQQAEEEGRPGPASSEARTHKLVHHGLQFLLGAFVAFAIVIAAEGDWRGAAWFGALAVLAAIMLLVNRRALV